MNPITDDGPATDDAYPRDARGQPYDPRRVPAPLLAPSGDVEDPHTDGDLHRPLRVYHRETSTGYEFYSAGDTGDEVIVTDVAVPLRARR
jgi:hypothetical protein